MRLAQALHRGGRQAAIVNADSAQVYADLAILSARPDDREMGGIRHLLFGAWDGAQACSAADWASAARDVIARLHSEGVVPILCGGTGLYLRTLLDGIAPIPPIDPTIRTAVRALDQPVARAALEQEDPAAAARLAPGDSARTMRALEVIRSTGRTLAHWQQEKRGGIAGAVTLHPLVLLPEREWLYARCDRRFETMLAAGAEAEVATLLARQLDPGLPVMRAIGVPEIAAMLRGEKTREAAAEAGKLATHRYAKRQYTWFRHQPPAAWARVAAAPDDVAEAFPALFATSSANALSAVPQS